MTKQVVVSVEESLRFAANGRLKPADKKEIANKKAKKFICPNCENDVEMSSIQFGENIICPKCQTVMLIQY